MKESLVFPFLKCKKFLSAIKTTVCFSNKNPEFWTWKEYLWRNTLWLNDTFFLYIMLPVHLLLLKPCIDWEFRNTAESEVPPWCFNQTSSLIIYSKWHIRNLRKCLCYTGQKDDWKDKMQDEKSLLPHEVKW